jgi:ligand-binding sensor domain-containing protein/signal transduction histidine kinase
MIYFPLHLRMLNSSKSPALGDETVQNPPVWGISLYPLQCGGKAIFVQYISSMLSRKAVILFLVCTTGLSNAFAQRYGFINYSTDQGLLQSQVFNLMQAADGHLWMTTMGGISRFDGKTFYNFSTREGLAAAFPIHSVIDYRQRIWAISGSHLNLIAGNKVYTYPLPHTVSGAWARLGVTPDNILWCLVNGVLYSFTGNQFVKAQVAGIGEHDFRALIPGENNSIWLMAPNRILYSYKQGSWQRFTSIKLADSTARIRNVYVDAKETVWVQTQNALMVQRSRDGELEPWFSLQDKKEYFVCITKDRQGNFWMGANTGAYKVKPDRSFIHFDHTNGFSEFAVNVIIPDKEGNIWLGTNGDGLVKYPGGIFTAYSADSDRPFAEVGIVKADRRGNLLFGSYGRDLCIYDGNTKKFPFRNTPLEQHHLLYAYVDSLNDIWIGTDGAGLWKYEKGKLRLVSFNRISVTYIYENEGKLIICTSEGLFAFKDGRLERNPAFREVIGKIIGAGKDSLLVAKRSGIALLRDTVKLSFKFPRGLEQTTITGFERRDDKIFIGTIGEGIFVWDKTTGKFNQVSVTRGLATDVVYSLIFDKTGNLWAGTGKGVSCISSTDGFRTVTIRNYDREQGFYGSETVSKAVAVKQDSTVWFGTIRGLFCYHPQEDRSGTAIPILTLQSLKLFSKPVVIDNDEERTSLPASASLPASLDLPAGKNHLTFEFNAISYDHTNIRYSYMLQGSETTFSEPDVANSVAYASLAPGNYIFKVKAIDHTGRQLGEMVTYPFSIAPAVYQTLWFKIVSALAALGLVLLLFRLRQVMLHKKQALVEALRAEEQSKIRKKTAQDFHDEMGNKLARIAVLSDILKSRLPLHDEAQGLAKKIEENVAQIYQGTKDIIWSLNPENDNLQFLLTYINNIGIDFFVDTEIEYEPMPVTESFHRFYLPMDHSRNLIMICKEVFTNTSKHAQCTRVTTEAAWVAKNKLQLTIRDNGKGFNTAASYNGNGLVNIKQRAGNLQAGMQLRSEAGTGTSLTIIFKVSENGQSNKPATDSHSFG